MQTIITFNTGRHYTAQGQRIAATKLFNGRVLFVDIDRGIKGVTDEQYHRAPVSLEQTLRDYDNGHYGYPTVENTQKGDDNLAALLDALRAAAAIAPTL